MVESSGRCTPRVRQTGLVVKELSGELLVYDKERNKAHSLNETAVSIWKQCDGHKTVAEIGRLLADDPKAPIDVEAIWLALDQFSKNNLLEEPVRRPKGVEKISRRDLIKRIGLTASIPLVVSIVAPTVFAAASCTQSCTLATFANDCTMPGCQGGC